LLDNWPAHQERRITWENDLAGHMVEPDGHQKDSPRYQQSINKR
jgi:hypothetical protein